VCPRRAPRFRCHRSQFRARSPDAVPGRPTPISVERRRARSPDSAPAYPTPCSRARFRSRSRDSGRARPPPRRCGRLRARSEIFASTNTRLRTSAAGSERAQPIPRPHTQRRPCSDDSTFPRPIPQRRGVWRSASPELTRVAQLWTSRARGCPRAPSAELLRPPRISLGRSVGARSPFSEPLRPRPRRFAVLRAASSALDPPRLRGRGSAPGDAVRARPSRPPSRRAGARSREPPPQRTRSVGVAHAASPADERARAWLLRFTRAGPGARAAPAVLVCSSRRACGLRGLPPGVAARPKLRWPRCGGGPSPSATPARAEPRRDERR
jgi:hypothetical protein